MNKQEVKDWWSKSGFTSYECGWLSPEEICYIKNICVWADGTLRPAKGHNGGCRWKFDGQVWYHLTN